jgi:hypothetical protein
MDQHQAEIRRLAARLAEIERKSEAQEQQSDISQIRSSLDQVKIRLQVLEDKSGKIDWQVWGSAIVAAIIGIVGVLVGSYYTYKLTDRATKTQAKKDYYMKCEKTMKTVRTNFYMYCLYQGDTTSKALETGLQDIAEMTGNYNLAKPEITDMTRSYQNAVVNAIFNTQRQVKRDTSYTMPLYRQTKPSYDKIMTALHDELANLNKE